MYLNLSRPPAHITRHTRCPFLSPHLYCHVSTNPFAISPETERTALPHVTEQPASRNTKELAKEVLKAAFSLTPIFASSLYFCVRLLRARGSHLIFHETCRRACPFLLFIWAPFRFFRFIPSIITNLEELLFLTHAHIRMHMAVFVSLVSNHNRVSSPFLLSIVFLSFFRIYVTL
jgi:hypothetical protein